MINGWVLAGGHLAEAAYLAQSIAPHNDQVRHSLKSGMPGCTVLDPSTPSDALSFFKTIGNELNSEASGISFLDAFAAIPAAVEGWLADQKNRMLSLKRIQRISL